MALASKLFRLSRCTTTDDWFKSASTGIFSALSTEDRIGGAAGSHDHFFIPVTRKQVLSSAGRERPPTDGSAGQATGHPNEELSYSDFVYGLKQALRDFSRPDLLTGNPLLRSRLLAAESPVGPADLQALLSRSVETLFLSPRDEKFRRVIELTYFRPAPKQEAAADRLSLPFGTYRRHLTTAVRRLARWLWDGEQAARAEVPQLNPRRRALHGDPVQPDPIQASPRLSIVVLPFVNLGDETAERFVDAITESLTTDLSRMPGTFVIARNTAFAYRDKAIDARQIGSELGVRYVMEGSVQIAEGRIRVNAQLIDAGTGAHLWAERFDKPRAEIFGMQDEIVARLARTLDEKLITVEARRSEQSRSANPDALDLFLRGWAAFNRGHNCDNLAEAERFFSQALALDPENVDVLAGLAMAKYAFAAIYATDERAAYFAAAESAAIKALTLSPDHARAHAALAYVYISTNRAKLGIAEAARALALDQNLAPCRAAIGWGKMMLGHAEEVEAHILDALRLSPRDSFAYVWCTMAGAAMLAQGRDDEAAGWLHRAIEASQTYPMAHLTLAATLALQGKISEARVAAAAGLALAPTFTIRRFRTRVLTNPTYLAQRQRLYDGLRLAGVPEGEPTISGSFSRCGASIRQRSIEVVASPKRAPRDPP
jgi:TolB-like protein